MTNPIEKNADNFIESIFKYGFEHYKDFILGLLIGMLLAWFYHRFLGSRELRKSYERTIIADEKHIATLKQVISERLGKITVEKADKRFFDGIKKYFS